jgi:deoxyhypusine synthase
MSKGPVSQFIQHHYRHFNAAALVDAAKGYETHLLEGGKMLVSLAGAMSTAELGISLAEMIRQDKVAIISCTGANLEEDMMNLVAHSHYKRVPNYRDLSPQEEWDLLENHYNRVTDTCILKKKLSAGYNSISIKYGPMQMQKAKDISRMSICTKCC